LFFKKLANLIAEDWYESPKIIILTLIPGHFDVITSLLRVLEQEIDDVPILFLDA
jgi:hypothetical protein